MGVVWVFVSNAARQSKGTEKRFGQAEQGKKELATILRNIPAMRLVLLTCVAVLTAALAAALAATSASAQEQELVRVPLTCVTDENFDVRCTGEGPNGPIVLEIPLEGGPKTITPEGTQFGFRSCTTLQGEEGQIVAHWCEGAFALVPDVPTAKEQCKEGGYEQFGFRNQGECVAFVERGPKGGGEVVPS